MSDLLALVDRLSRPHTSRVLQPTDEEPGRVTVVEHDALIAQLRSAVASSLTGGNGVAGKADRIPINAVALDAYQELENAIADEFHNAGGRVEHLLPEDTLREWYTLTLAHNLTDDRTRELVAWLTTWVRRIEEMLNPPKGVLDILKPCPICGERRVITDPATGDVAAAVKITYREDDASDACGMCSACGTVWRGMTAVRALAYDLEQEA